MRDGPAIAANSAGSLSRKTKGDIFMDPWAQRLVAVGFLISSIALLIGTTTYAYKELAPFTTGSAAAKKK
jgi:hypothetical protein